MEKLTTKEIKFIEDLLVKVKTFPINNNDYDFLSYIKKRGFTKTAEWDEKTRYDLQPFGEFQIDFLKIYDDDEQKYILHSVEIINHFTLNILPRTVFYAKPPETKELADNLFEMLEIPNNLTLLQNKSININEA